jgi:mannose-6-phosphate isomerase-like protein (cupin superfamily)
MARVGDELVNPITGERIVFRKTAAETHGTLLEMDAFWTQPGHRAPAHLHPGMQERWEVISGAATFAVDGVERSAGPGEVVLAPPGVPHQAWNATVEPAHLRIQMRPALRWETFVERLFALAADGYRDGRSTPDPALMLELLREFPHEIALAPGNRSPGAG